VQLRKHTIKQNKLICKRGIFMKIVKKSLKQLLGEDYTGAAASGSSVLGYLSKEDALRLANEEVDFISEEYIGTVLWSPHGAPPRSGGARGDPADPAAGVRGAVQADSG
jgi:hypothetical protein